MVKPQKDIAILVPAHNEEIVINETLKRLLQVASKEDIYLVDDCSRDKTAKIAKKHIKNILSLKINVGKAQALNTAIKHFQLSKKYKYLLPIDADTKITQEFLNPILSVFRKDKKRNIVAVVGKIKGAHNSWVTAYRMWEYEIGQTIHKEAQSKEGAILVCSGCTTVYRTNLFKKHQFSSDTLTEDMDLTFQIHRKKLGKIVFCQEAVAITQDPLTLKDFIKQIERWYYGYWQCIYKHRIPFGKQMIDFEAAVASTEGLLGALIVFGLVILSPWLITHNPWILLTGILLDLGLLFLPTILLTCMKYRNWKLLEYIFHFYLLRLLSSLVFLKSFLKVTFMTNPLAQWNQVQRYNFKGV